MDKNSLKYHAFVTLVLCAVATGLHVFGVFGV
jgi:hypothetical protein